MFQTLNLPQQSQHSLSEQPTSRDATTGFLVTWRLRNVCRNSVLMTCHYQDVGSASDWMKQI